MKHRIRRIVLTIFSLALLLTLCSGMGGKPLDADDMTAVSKVSISNKEVVSQNRPIIVTFSEAMVKPDAVDKPVPEKDMPFRISPALKGDGRWLTEKSFSFASSGGYPRGKQYFVIFKDNLRSLDKKPVRYFFSFRTQAVSVKNVWPNPYDEAKKEISLLMSFNLPVTAESLREHLTIRDAASDETLEYNLRDMQRDASEHEILIRTDALRPKLALSIALDGDSDRTSLGFAKAYEDKDFQDAMKKLNIPAMYMTGEDFAKEAKLGYEDSTRILKAMGLMQN